jgi:hypothetical protein
MGPPYPRKREQGGGGVCASGASGAEERRSGNQRRRDPSLIGADSLSIPHFLPCHIPLFTAFVSGRSSPPQPPNTFVHALDGPAGFARPAYNTFDTMLVGMYNQQSCYESY